MTDKEQIAKWLKGKLAELCNEVQCEVPSLPKVIIEGKILAFKEILSYMNSLQEESVSEFLNIESMIESYKQKLISQANGIKNNPLIDMCLASYKHGINETLDTLNLSNVERTVKGWKEEPVSGNLEEAIDTYLATYFGDKKEMQNWPFLKKMAIHFANWQKQQMMKDAVDVDYDNLIAYDIIYKICQVLGKGGKGKLIVIKEEEE